jgi:hypothetical protein
LVLASFPADVVEFAPPTGDKPRHEIVLAVSLVQELPNARFFAAKHSPKGRRSFQYGDEFANGKFYLAALQRFSPREYVLINAVY